MPLPLPPIRPTRPRSPVTRAVGALRRLLLPPGASTRFQIALATLLLVAVVSAIALMQLGARGGPTTYRGASAPAQQNGLASPTDGPTSTVTSTSTTTQQDVSSAQITFMPFWLGYEPPSNDQNTVIVATDGTGDVRATPKTVTVDSWSCPCMGVSPWFDAVTSGSQYVVPANCPANLSASDWSIEDSSVDQALSRTMNPPSNYSQNDTVAYFDAGKSHTHTGFCSPAPGTTQATFFQYQVYESGSWTIGLFNPQDVGGFCLARIKSTVPAGYRYYGVTGWTHMTGQGDVGLFTLSPTRARMYCNFQSGMSVYDWTSMRLQALAQQLAGHDVATAQQILMHTTGIAADSMTPQIVLSGTTTLPRDPSHITFHIVPIPCPPCSYH